MTAPQPADLAPGVLARLAAAEALDRVVRQRIDLDRAFAPPAALSASDRAFAYSILVTALRRRGQIAAILDALIERPLPTGAGLARSLLETACAQLLFMGVAPHAVIHSAVAACREDRHARHFAALANAVLRRVGKFAAADAGAVAAAFGSVSVVTFIAANTLGQLRGTPPEGFMPALVAMLEVPGILVALGLAAGADHRKEPWGAVLRETLFGQSIVCLLGGLVIGWVTGRPGLDEVAGFFVTPFKGALVLFLLELGMVAAKRLRDLRAAGPFLVGFGLVAAPVFGIAGVFAGQLSGLSPAGAAVMGAMAASASYIAAPAAVRAGLPDANPAYYLPLALGVVFPFNLTIEIGRAHV